MWLPRLSLGAARRVISAAENRALGIRLQVSTWLQELRIHRQRGTRSHGRTGKETAFIHTKQHSVCLMNCWRLPLVRDEWELRYFRAYFSSAVAESQWFSGKCEDMDRRDFLIMRACFSRASVLASFLAPLDQVPQPKADFTLRIAPVSFEIAPGKTILTLRYNGQVPGLLADEGGIPVTVDVLVDTDHEEIVHWHGQMISVEATERRKKAARRFLSTGIDDITSLRSRPARAGITATRLPGKTFIAASTPGSSVLFISSRRLIPAV